MGVRVYIPDQLACLVILSPLLLSDRMCYPVQGIRSAFIVPHTLGRCRDRTIPAGRGKPLIPKGGFPYVTRLVGAALSTPI